MDVSRLLNPLPALDAAESLMLLTSDTSPNDQRPEALELLSPVPRPAALAPLSPLSLKLATSPDEVCAVTGCLRAARAGGRKCVVHKGLKLCSVAGCCRPVQSRGVCKSHGGGARCKHPACAKGAISKGRCRSHGGGSRCAVPDCAKWAQRLGCCVRHSKTVARGLPC